MVRPGLLSRASVRRSVPTRPRVPAVAGALALILSTGGCAPDARDAASIDESHAGLACAACHQGEIADRGHASVPAAACTRSGCHSDNGPDGVRVGTVSFEHRDHAAGSGFAPGCAGCHSHDTGTEPVTAGVDACALCHIGEISSGIGEDCRLCHERPAHTARTSQGVPVPHEGLPWITGGCVRCHFDVAEAPSHVPLSRCVTCHVPVMEAAAAGIGTDLHSSHRGSSCTSCHESELHRIEAMSSAVRLECGQCHGGAHGLDLAGGWPDAVTCGACHRATHEEQQRLVLGLLPTDMAAAPSEKFLAGVTCRSCHVTPASSASTQAEACVGCHRAEYATVLRWWNQGSAERVRLVDAYWSRASGQLTAGPEGAGQALEEARRLLDVVARGGGEHNILLSHRALVESLERTASAYRSAGRTPPVVPDLGRQPRMGLCSYCHYRLNDPMLFRDMPADFHREVLRTGS